MKNSKKIILASLVIITVVLLIVLSLKLKKESPAKLLEPDDEYILAINLVDSTTAEVLIDFSNDNKCSFSIYSDEECKNLVKQVVISEESSNGKNSYITQEKLPKGTYYIYIDVVPNGYELPKEIFTMTVDDEKQKNLWNIEIEKSKDTTSSILDEETLGKLEIVNTLENGNYAGYSAAVFSIEANSEGRKVYSNIFSTMLFQDNPETILVNDLIIPSEAIVKLIYTSPNCRTVVYDNVETTIEVNKNSKVEFKFKNSELATRTIGLTNLNFTYNSTENVLEVKEESGIGKNPIKTSISDVISTTIKNSDNSNKYVRMKILGMRDGMTVSYEEEKWNIGNDGYYYYSNVLENNESCLALNIHASLDYEQDITFNAVIVLESTDVLYDSDGNPYADWEATVNTEQTSTID